MEMLLKIIVGYSCDDWSLLSPLAYFKANIPAFRIYKIIALLWYMTLVWEKKLHFMRIDEPIDTRALGY